MDKPSRSANYEIGYRKPPRKTQFAKGQSGNPRGRPKSPEAVSLDHILSEKQRGKNGAVTTRREALVVKLLRDAMNGKPRAFARFVNLMIRAGLLQKETSPQGGRVIFFSRDPAVPPYTKNPLTGAKEPVS